MDASTTVTIGHDNLGRALVEFERSMDAFQTALADDPMLAEMVFAGTRDWVNLLKYKLVPHLGGKGCLIAAVTGGTNSGKSTIFNLLLGREVSPVVATAAATKRPLLVGNPARAAQSLEAKLVPEFRPVVFDRPDSILTHAAPPEALFVAEDRSLPEALVLLDTPDVDSIDKQNWEVANHLRAAGDVLIAVLTPEKYRDERVVAFFREALSSGRVVIPLMNKADPANDFAVAKQQLDEFASDLGLENGPRFAVPHDYGLAKDFSRRIVSLDGGPDLRAHIEELDTSAIKRRVYHATVLHLAGKAEEFIEHSAAVGNVLSSVENEFTSRAQRHAAKYDPAPGKEVGGLFHEFVQARRGPLRRSIGAVSAAVVRGAGSIGRRLGTALLRRATLEAEKARIGEEEVREMHKQVVQQLARELATSYVESRGNLREPAAHLIAAALDGLDIDKAVQRITDETLGSESISKEFRQHANRTIQAWWDDHTGKRRVLEALDTLLAVVPAAIAAPISMYTGGVGVPEAVVLAGPFVEQFVARVIEYQFGDAMFDFLSPWRKEQQANLEKAMLEHLTDPTLDHLRTMADVFEGETVEGLRKWREECLKAL